MEFDCLHHGGICATNWTRWWSVPYRSFNVTGFYDGEFREGRAEQGTFFNTKIFTLLIWTVVK